MTDAEPVTPALPAPELDVYVVFAQRTDARVDIDAWSAHAERFFATRLGLAEDMRPLMGASAPRVDRARFVVAPGDGTGDGPGIRQASARPRDERDLALAERADGAGTGLALLARRCPTVWLVTREGEGDRLALRLATILSSVLLGPILDPGRMELFGAKTARGKLERPRPPIA
jgi:hypothetical protein